MSDWMAAADAMVHSTAGLTVLEAHIRGCPVVSYGFSAGHLRANNAAFERFGLAEVARSEHELESLAAPPDPRAPLARFLASPRCRRSPRGPSTARPRVRPQPVWRVRAERTATAVSDRRSSPIRPAIALALDREAPYRAGRSPNRSRAASTSARTKTAAERPKPVVAADPSTGPHSAAAPRFSPGPPSTPAPALAPVVPRVGGRSGSCRARRAPTASRSPSTTARTRRGRRRCSRYCARRAPRRPSSSPASRSSGAPRAGGGDRRRRPPRRAALPPASQRSCG